jgi:hypothetical protein
VKEPPRSIVYTLLRLDLLPVCVLYLPHLGDRVRPLYDLRMSIPPCQYKVKKGRLAIYQFDYLREVQELQTEGVIDLVEDKEIESTGERLLPGKLYCFLRVRPVFLKGITDCPGCRKILFPSCGIPRLAQVS